MLSNSRGSHALLVDMIFVEVVAVFVNSQGSCSVTLLDWQRTPCIKKHMPTALPPDLYTSRVQSKKMHRCTCYVSLLVIEYTVLLTKCLSWNDARMWCSVCKLCAYVPLRITRHFTKIRNYIVESAGLNA